MMIEQQTFTFLQELKENNYREWFHTQKPRYDRAKANILEVGEELVKGINRFDPSLGQPELRKCMFRIARDTRFSHDKSPYKTNMGLLFSPNSSTRCELSCYYMHIEPGGSFISCGVYMPQKEVLKAVREAIDDQWDDFWAIIRQPDFVKAFGDLSREGKVLKGVPRGFDKESPAAEYLKLSSFYVWVALKDEMVTSKKMVPESLRLFELMKPLNDFMNRTIKNQQP